MLNHYGSNNSGLREERRAVFSEIYNDEGNKRPMTTSLSHKGKSMPDASGDARLPNLVCVSDLQLESKLTEDFRKEMEKQRKSNYEPKSTKWSYTGALQSLQNFMENEYTDKDNFSKSDVGEEQNTNKSTGHTRNDDDQNKDIKADYGSLLETVGELLNQIYTKYSTVMLDGGGKNGTSHHLESESRAELEMKCVSQEGSHAYSDHVKFKEEKLNITKKNFTTNQGKSSQNRGKYNSNNIEIVQKDRPKKEEMQTTLPRVEQCKTKEKNIQYPRSKWQPVEEDNEIEEQNRNIVKAELVKELQECEEKLKELYSEESFSSDDESSTATSSECTEDSATENAESDYDSDSERYYGIKKPMVEGALYQTEMGQYILLKWFSTKYPQAYDNLKTNTHRLTTFYDIHQTLHDVVQNKFPRQQPQTVFKYGTSLFGPVSENRDCPGAGIEPHWCACGAYEDVPVEDPRAQQAARILFEALRKYNKINITANQCIDFNSFHLIQAKVKVQGHADGKSRIAKQEISLSIKVQPLSAQFRSTIRLDEGNIPLLFHIERLDNYGSQSNCLNIKNPVIEVTCICKNWKAD